MKECRDILKELFSKRHTAYAWPFYKPVDTTIFKDYRYEGRVLLIVGMSNISDQVAPNLLQEICQAPHGPGDDRHQAGGG